MQRKEPKYGRRAGVAAQHESEPIVRKSSDVPKYGRRAGCEEKGFSVLTKEQASALGGLPPHLSEQIKSTTKQHSVAVSFRMSLPYQLADGAPKPATVKAKTGNWGFTKGVIAVDSEVLGRVEKDGSIRRHESKDLPKNSSGAIALPAVQHTIALGEIIQGLDKIPPEYKIVSDEKNPNELKVQTILGNPNQDQVIYSINLNEGKPKGSHSSDEKASQTPTWWQEDKWGSFAEKSSLHFPASYEADGARKPLQVYGLPDSQGQTVPITGDHDLLWITRTPQESAKVAEVYDTSTVGGAYQLSKELIKYDKAFAEANSTEPKFKSHNDIPAEVIATLGRVTAAEAYTIMDINAGYLNKSTLGGEALKNPIQHGCENHTPYKPSDLDGPMLHFYKDHIIMTKDEKSLVDFLVHHKDYLKENIVDVHPQWNMELWGKVVAKQLELGQESQLSKETVSSYKSFSEHAAAKTPEPEATSMKLR